MSIDRLRRRMNGATGDAGITLIELLVVGAISSILLAAVGITFTSSLKASRTATARVSATAEARVAMEVVASRLRVAVRPPDPDTTDAVNPFPSIIREAHADRLEFFASISADDLDPAPSRVQYWVERDDVAPGTKTCLRERVTPYTAPRPPLGPDSADPGRCIAFGGVTAPLFSYYSGVPQPTEAEPSPMVTAPSLLAGPGGCSDYDTPTVPECDAIYSVQVDMALQSLTTTGGKPVATSTRILLVNRHSEDLA